MFKISVEFNYIFNPSIKFVANYLLGHYTLNRINYLSFKKAVDIMIHYNLYVILNNLYVRVFGIMVGYQCTCTGKEVAVRFQLIY